MMLLANFVLKCQFVQLRKRQPHLLLYPFKNTTKNLSQSRQGLGTWVLFLEFLKKKKKNRHRKYAGGTHKGAFFFLNLVR